MLTIAASVDPKRVTPREPPFLLTRNQLNTPALEIVISGLFRQAIHGMPQGVFEVRNIIQSSFRASWR